MQKNNYYEITEKYTYKGIPVRFIEKEDNFYKVYFPQENVEKNLNDNILFRDLTLTNTHLERIGYMNANGKFLPVNGYYLFPQYAVGGKSNYDLSFLFFGYYLVKEEDAAQYWLDYKSVTEKYIKGDIELENIKDKFPGIYNINILNERLQSLEIPLDNIDFIASGVNSKP